MTWQAFVLEHGRGVPAHHLAAIVGQPANVVQNVRSNSGCRRGPVLPFPELFAKWHGRPPADEDWPVPTRSKHQAYEWLGPEIALLASLVGRMGPAEIAAVLTERLRRITGDPAAVRQRHLVTVRINRIGLVQSDVLGGLTVNEAAKYAGVTVNLINQERFRGNIRTFRVGTRVVIPIAAIEEWQASRLPAPPKGWVKLWDLEKSLGMTGTSRMSWYAKNGLIDGAVFCAGRRWWISPENAAELLRRYRAGEPLPWYGKYNHPSTTKRSYELWQRRRHQHCDECRAIWGAVGGEPTTFEEFHPRWIRIPEARKRHVTAPDGLSAEKAGELLGVDKHTVTTAIRRGELLGRREGPRWVIRRADLEAWVHRPGVLSHHHDTQPLTFRHAAARYQFEVSFLRHFADHGLLVLVPRSDGQPGLRAWQIASLRALLGDTTLSQAAAAAGVSPQTFLRDARARGWRPGQPITREWIERARARQAAGWHLTLEHAARRLDRPMAWIRRAIELGVLKPLKGVDRRKTVLGRKAVEALIRRGIPELPAERSDNGTVWLQGFAAIDLAGVTRSTLVRWMKDGEIRSRPWTPADGPYGLRYDKASVEQRARRYWQFENRRKRAVPPAWLTAEQENPAA